MHLTILPSLELAMVFPTHNPPAWAVMVAATHKLHPLTV